MSIWSCKKFRKKFFSVFIVIKLSLSISKKQTKILQNFSDNFSNFRFQFKISAFETCSFRIFFEFFAFWKSIYLRNLSKAHSPKLFVLFRGMFLKHVLFYLEHNGSLIDTFHACIRQKKLSNGRKNSHRSGNCNRISRQIQLFQNYSGGQNPRQLVQIRDFVIG